MGEQGALAVVGR